MRKLNSLLAGVGISLALAGCDSDYIPNKVNLAQLEKFRNYKI